MENTQDAISEADVAKVHSNNGNVLQSTDVSVAESPETGEDPGPGDGIPRDRGWSWMILFGMFLL